VDVIFGLGFRKLFGKKTTRDPSSRAARELEDLGADLVRGNLDDRASLDQALRGAYGCYSVQNFWEIGVEGEVRQGIALADAARDAGVQHFVYSSVASANHRTGIPHFESKWRIEEHIRGIGLRYSILRPVFFMENWRDYCRESILAGTLPLPLDPGRPLPQVCVDDIGAFGAMAFCHPDRWLRRELDLAGDELTLPQVAEALSEAIGSRVSYAQISWDDFRAAAGEDSTKMFQWLNDVGYSANIPALRNEHPGLKRLGDCLPVHGWHRVEEMVGAASR
jgi:uncharacterized protein YbjT (DUF2867 family)